MAFLLHSNSFLIMGAARVSTCPDIAPLSETRLHGYAFPFMAMRSRNFGGKSKKSPAALGGLEGDGGAEIQWQQLVRFFLPP